VTVALTSARARHVTIRWGLGLSFAAVVLALLNPLLDAPSLLGVSSLVQMVLLVLAVGAILRAVITETEVGFRTILGAISVYLIFGLLFTFLYAAVDRLQSGLFFGQPVGNGDYVFFSFTTLTTTGYGDLIPAGQPGKMFAGLEMLLGQIFLVTLIAGLVSLWRPGPVARTLRERASRDSDPAE
jgi:ion channel